MPSVPSIAVSLFVGIFLSLTNTESEANPNNLRTHQRVSQAFSSLVIVLVILAATCTTTKFLSRQVMFYISRLGKGITQIFLCVCFSFIPPEEKQWQIWPLANGCLLLKKLLGLLYQLDCYTCYWPCYFLLTTTYISCYPQSMNCFVGFPTALVSRAVQLCVLQLHNSEMTFPSLVPVTDTLGHRVQTNIWRCK